MPETTGRSWEKFFSQIGQQADIAETDYVLGLRILSKDNPDPDSSGSNFVVTYNKINFYKKVTITAAQLKTCGTTFVPIIAAPGAGFFIADSKIVVTRAGGGAAYGFGDYLSFGTEGGDSQYIIDNALFNTPGALNIAPIRQGQNQIENAAFGVTVIGGAVNDSATGDKDIDVEIYYTIHAIKS